MKFKEQLHNKIDYIYNECKKDNWDGYDAPAITKDVVEKSHEFINNFSENIPIPEIYADATGSMCFEWENDNRNYVEITIMDESQKMIFLQRHNDELQTILIKYTKEIINNLIPKIINFVNTGEKISITGEKISI